MRYCLAAPYPLIFKVGSITYHRNQNIKSWVTFCHLSDSLRLKLPVTLRLKFGCARLNEQAR